MRDGYVFINGERLSEPFFSLPTEAERAAAGDEARATAISCWVITEPCPAIRAAGVSSLVTASLGGPR